MASTYSNIKIQLMATGENSGTWGNVTNVNLGTAIEQAMVETATVTFASANVTLTLSDTNAAQDARALRLNLTGTTGGARDLIVPAVQKPYIVNNGTADIITIKVSGQTGVAVPASKTMLVYNNGTDVVDAINHLSALNLSTALPIASGGTGTNVTTFANLESNVSGTLPVANGGTSAASLDAESVVVGNGTSAVKFVAPGTDGNVLTSNGTSWVSEAPVIPQGVPTGSVMTFAGDPGAGWLEANGQVVSQSTYSDLYAKVGLIVDGMQTTTAQATIQGGGNGVSTYFTSLAYGNSIYVASAQHGSLAYIRHYTSTDAVTWTARSFGWVVGTQTFARVIYTDKFVGIFAVSSTAETNRNNIYTSTDAITWTPRTGTVASGLEDIAYGGSTYVIATPSQAQGTMFASSTDGITWTARTGAVTAYSTRLAYGNGVFVAVSLGTSPIFKPVIQTSTDGITWTYRSTAIRHPSYRSGITFDGDKFWIASNRQVNADGAVLITSTDGINWNLNTTLAKYLGSVGSIGYDSTNDILIAYGPSNSLGGLSLGRFMTSKDKGVTWSISTPSAVVTAPTTTSGDMAPFGRSMIPYTSYSVGGVNGKIYIAGYGSTAGTSDAAEYDNAVLKIDNPYSYQTDTQFIVPFATGLNGITSGSQLAGLKYSNNTIGFGGIDLKYYIKT